ncbi:hypothetical protein [Epilithonimonas sp. UC225_85]|uniref:hypothetical protein n=1 Tax=Epilithonimonas sp. UC225_85 TaxID=3350167 RepID=UPI0036D3834E
MAYSQTEQENLDLDLFFKDSEKQIHIATGGGQIPSRLAEVDNLIENFRQERLDLIIENYEITVNPNLGEILGLNESELLNYLIDFEMIAKKGFF